MSRFICTIEVKLKRMNSNKSALSVNYYGASQTEQIARHSSTNKACLIFCLHHQSIIYSIFHRIIIFVGSNPVDVAVIFTSKNTKKSGHGLYKIIIRYKLYRLAYSLYRNGSSKLAFSTPNWKLQTSMCQLTLWELILRVNCGFNAHINHRPILTFWWN